MPIAIDAAKRAAPDLAADGWPEKFARATVRRGWQTRIDAALREWIGKHDVA